MVNNSLPPLFLFQPPRRPPEYRFHEMRRQRQEQSEALGFPFHGVTALIDDTKMQDHFYTPKSSLLNGGSGQMDDEKKALNLSRARALLSRITG